MRIVHVIPCRYPLNGYGGTERVCYWLAKAQIELGHEVKVVCLEGSSLPFAKTIDWNGKEESLAKLIPSDFDIIQMYQTPRLELPLPVLVNIGGNGQSGEKFHSNTVFVSKSHAERHGWKEFVHNGIDLAEYPLVKSKENFLCFLAKASWRVKNLKGAIHLARRAGMPLHICGGSAPFWESLRGGVKNHGMVDGEEKLRWLSRARALLFPVVWQEPFGLAVVEALACGTPVVATPFGALPEILTTNCGVLSDTYDGLLEGIASARHLDPEACRARVEEKFTHLHMAENYLFYYKKVLQEGRLAPGNPQTPVGQDPQEKLTIRALS